MTETKDINIAIKTLKDRGLTEKENVLKSIISSNNYSKSKEITAYFFDCLNVDDIYSNEEFYEFVAEVYFIITN